MQNSPQKQPKNKTNWGISIRDALSEILGNSHIMMLPTILALVLCTVCFALLIFPQNTTENCDTNHHIYQALLSQNQEWLAYFAAVPESSNNGITLDGGRYVVRSFWRSSDEQPILIIATQHTYPRSLYGLAGYVYTSNESFSFPDNRYTTRQLSPHFYCYERISS